MANVFDKVVERLSDKGIDVYLDGPSIIYIHKKTGVKLVEFINGVGSAADRLALESELKEALFQAKNIVTVPLNKNQLSALASFIAHIGIDNFAKSELLIELNKGNYKAVPKLMQRFRVGKIGKYSRPTIRSDYVARRRYEAELFSTPGHLKWQIEADGSQNTLYPDQKNINFNEMRSILILAKKRAYNKLGIFF